LFHRCIYGAYNDETRQTVVVNHCNTPIAGASIVVVVYPRFSRAPEPRGSSVAHALRALAISISCVIVCV